jgi:preprotein translocase subunit Sss1
MHTLLFLGVYAAGFLLTLIANPAFSFVLYEAVYFFNPAQRWWSYSVPSLSYSFFTVLLMFGALILKMMRKESNSSNSILAAPQFKWLYLLVILYLIAWTYAARPDLHEPAAINYLKLMIIISVAYKLIDTVKNLDLALWGYVFGAWYVSFLTWQTGRNSGNRVEGIGTVDSPDANGIAAALAPSLVICLYYVWISRNLVAKGLFALGGVFIANALILINSRASFLAAGASIVFFMFFMYFSSFQRKFQKASAIGLTVIGLAGFLYLADDSFFSRIQTIKNTEISEEQESHTTRLLFWLAALEMAQDYPFGNGVRGFDYYAPYYIPEDVDTGAHRNRSVHSTWMETLTEIGYPGIIVFLLALYSSFQTTRKCLKVLKEKGDADEYFKIIMLQAACLAYVVAMTFMNRFRAEILYWLILYTACAYNIYVLKGYTEKESEKKAVKAALDPN